MAVVFIDDSPAAQSPSRATTRLLLPCPQVSRAQINISLFTFGISFTNAYQVVEP
ncbi:MAG: hypothetical protein ACI9QV_000087 [Methylophagaceae bacterium]|jgi:hypothetical protein